MRGSYFQVLEDIIFPYRVINESHWFQVIMEHYVYNYIHQLSIINGTIHIISFSMELWTLNVNFIQMEYEWNLHMEDLHFNRWNSIDIMTCGFFCGWAGELQSSWTRGRDNQWKIHGKFMENQPKKCPPFAPKKWDNGVFNAWRTENNQTIMMSH